MRCLDRSFSSGSVRLYVQKNSVMQCLKSSGHAAENVGGHGSAVPQLDLIEEGLKPVRYVFLARSRVQLRKSTPAGLRSSFRKR
jgi:hypothetical protein